MSLSRSHHLLGLLCKMHIFIWIEFSSLYNDHQQDNVIIKLEFYFCLTARQYVSQNSRCWLALCMYRYTCTSMLLKRMQKDCSTVQFLYFILLIRTTQNTSLSSQHIRFRMASRGLQDIKTKKTITKVATTNIIQMNVPTHPLLPSFSITVT